MSDCESDSPSQAARSTSAAPSHSRVKRKRSPQSDVLPNQHPFPFPGLSAAIQPSLPKKPKITTPNAAAEQLPPFAPQVRRHLGTFAVILNHID